MSPLGAVPTTLPGTLPRGRATRRFPLGDRLVRQHPVGGIPSPVEEGGIDRILGGALHHPFFVGAFGKRLLAAQKARSQRNRLGSQAERGHETTAVGDTSRRNDWDRLHRLDHRWQEGGERCRTLHMPPNLQPLGDDPIDASLRRRPGFLDRPYLEKYLDAAAASVGPAKAPMPTEKIGAVIPR